MDPVQLVLNTRHGTLASPTAFNACRWALADPIMCPPDHALYISVTFVSLPGDHHRINDFRATTALRIETVDKNSPDVIVPNDIYIPAGSYTRDGFIKSLNKALQDALVAAQFEFLEERDEWVLRTEEVRLWSKDPDLAHRVVPTPGFNATEALGFHTTSEWATNVSPALPHSVMDTQGTRTITIQARNIATNAMDPVELTRRRAVLAVIPSPTNTYNQSWIWERTFMNPSFIPAKHLCIIELSLFDDMGMPVNPNHHWSIGLEIIAKRREYFVSNM